MTLAACVWVAIGAGTTLIGWRLGDIRWINFPIPERYGTMLPITAVNLLLMMSTLWLLRREPVPPVGRWISSGLVAVTMTTSLLVLTEYATGRDLGIDLTLFAETVRGIVPRHSGRPTVTTSVCFLALGAAVLMLDRPSMIVQRVSELLLLFVMFIGGERLISFIFGQTGLWTAASRLFSEPVLIPMAPWTASCLLVLGLGFLFSRPSRGLVGLYLARDAGGMLVRRILPAAIVLPIVFGWLGLEATRIAPRTVYPLSLVVSFQIAFLLIVITQNARDFERIDAERKRAEKALVERERLLRAVFDNAGVGIAVVDVDGYPIRTNRTLQKMLGYDGGELMGMRFTEFTHPDDVAVDWELYQELIHGVRNFYRIEKRFIRKDGNQFWAQLDASVSHDAQHRLELVIAVVGDITDRKNAEEATRRLTAILEATPDFVGIADASGNSVYVNQAGRQLTGIGDADVTGLSIAEFHPLASARRVLHEGVPTALREGFWVGETELLGPRDEHIPVSQVILAHRDSSGNVAQISTVMRDITDRKRMEESQRFLLDAGNAFSGSLDIDAILHSIAGLIVPYLADCCEMDLVTSDGRVERAAIARSGPSRRCVVRNRLHPSGKRPNDAVTEVIQSGEAILIPTVTDEWMTKLTREGRHVDLLRGPRPLSLMIVPVPGRDRVQGVISFLMTRPGRQYNAHDLNLARELAVRAGLALDNARLFEESRQATRVRDEVLRVVAHDLRNPLNTIALGADLLHEQLPKGTEAAWEDTLNVIALSVGQADHLIQDLLEVARIQAGKLVIEPEPTDANTLVTDAIEMHESIAAQRAIELRASVPETLPVIRADRPRVLQVFSNLIGNALRFSPKGGTVTVGATVQGDEVRFSVRDHGPGISESDITHLFEPFWQARAGTGGTGLGLTIARSIVEAHGGRIWVWSRPGRGSIFFFTLPATAAAAKAAD